MLIVIYLFTAGISAGDFFVSGLATYLGGEQLRAPQPHWRVAGPLAVHAWAWARLSST